MNPAFAVSQQIGNKLGAAFKEGRDESFIDKVLTEAVARGDQQGLTDAMTQILSNVSPERQPMALKFLESKLQNISQQTQNQALEKEGVNPNLPPGIQKSQYENIQNQKMANTIINPPLAKPNMQVQNQSFIPGMQMPEEGAPPLKQTQPEQAPQDEGVQWNKLSDEQLVKLTGVKGFGQQAQAEQKRRIEEKKAAQGSYEPESEKLEAKRVASLADEVENDYKAAANEDLRLDRMVVLDKEKNVSAPTLIKVLDAFGLPIGILSNPATEEFRKLEADFVRDVSKVFPGGKVTNYELQSYLRTIPGLMNSPEGRKEIIRNRKLMNEAKKVRYDEYKKILKENNGKKPQNLGILLEERTQDKIADIEDRFREGIEKSVDKFQTPLRMYDPQGNPIDVPPKDVDRALKAGAKFG